MPENPWWMVRAGAGVWLDAFIRERFVGIGFIDADISAATEKYVIASLVVQASPGAKKGRVVAIASQVHRFRNVFEPGDTVATFNAKDRVYHLGHITGGYVFKAGCQPPHRRPVEWIANVSRDALSAGTRNRLGSIATIFAIDAQTQIELGRFAAPARRGLSAT